MARTAATKRYFNFIGGKNSDASALAPAENSARIMQNVDLDRSGKISRRYGLDYEDGYFMQPEVSSGVLSTASVSVHRWDTVANRPNLNFIVVRIGHTLDFYNAGDVPLSPSKIFSIDITPMAALPDIAQDNPIQVDAGAGLLFISGVGYRPFYIRHDPTGENPTTPVVIRALVRDTIGADDEIDVDNRPFELSQAHAWNLSNQGWEAGRITEFRRLRGGFPSNADIQFLGYRIDVEEGNKVWDSYEIVNSDLGNSPAAKGKNFLDAFHPSRLAVYDASTSAVNFSVQIPYSDPRYPWANATGALTKTLLFKNIPPLLESLSTAGDIGIRPKAIAFYSGRVWYASLNGKVFFSQIVESEANIGRCYQAQDPTAEDFNELVDTDGGFLSLPEIGDCHSMIASTKGLILFCTNGIWSISGGESNFTANNALVTKVSPVKVNNGQAAVDTDAGIFFWSEEGIFVIVSDEITGNATIKSVSVGRIQNDYNEISAEAQEGAKGYYDESKKKIYWTYAGQGSISGPLQPKERHDAVLIYDITINAFYDYSLATFGLNIQGGSPFLAGIFRRPAVSEVESTVDVYSGSDIVVAGVDTVNFNGVEKVSKIAPITALCFEPNGLYTITGYNYTFGEFRSRTFHDWVSSDGHERSYGSVVETYSETLGDAVMDKQATYMFCYTESLRDRFNFDIGGEY